jgi:site-specific recombinase XerD
MFEVLNATGIRISELFHLRVKDVICSDLFVQSGKGNKSRLVHIIYGNMLLVCLLIAIDEVTERL